MLLLILGLSAFGGTCAAQTAIHHCTAPDGTPVFTDRTCASVGAVTDAAPINPLQPRPARGPQHCPLDAPALRKRVAAAFRIGNANALAGLMLWHGYRADEADAIVRYLAGLMRTPFRGVVDATQSMGPALPASTGLPPLLPPPPAPEPNAIVRDTLTVSLGGPATRAVTFDVTRRDGCVWLEPPAVTADSTP